MSDKFAKVANCSALHQFRSIEVENVRKADEWQSKKLVNWKANSGKKVANVHKNSDKQKKKRLTVDSIGNFWKQLIWQNQQLGIRKAVKIDQEEVMRSLSREEVVPKNVASIYQQQFKLEMQQRKRLMKANRKPVDSFEQCVPVSAPERNVLDSIQNQNLYLKLVAIALEMSRKAGVHQNSILEMQGKLLAAKGLQEHSMLHQQNVQQIRKQFYYNHQYSYNLSKKLVDPEEQLAFINRMENELQKNQTKEHIIYAIKQYVQKKKKSLTSEITQTSTPTKIKTFLQKAKAHYLRKKVQQRNLHGQTLREIIGRLNPEKSRVYETLRSMIHLKTLWGHTFFTESEEQYCPVYNVIFDNKEKLIISGGEDGKIKVWSRDTGGLVSTLQGHKDYINKICVTKNNQIVLSAAQDGVRFFDLYNMESLGGFQTQSIMDICEIVHNNSEESSIIFANNSKLFVLPTKTIFISKNRKLHAYDFKIYNFGSKISKDTVNTFTLTSTPQGIVFLGFTQGQILIFDFYKLANAQIDHQYYSIVEGMSKIQEFVLPIICVFNAHEADILEIKWNSVLSCFSTGAKKDGVCKIWQLKTQQSSSRPILIKQLKIPKHKMKRKKKIYNCNFCCWNSTYTHITCSFEQQELQEQSETRGDGQVIVYNATKMEITWEMSKNIDLSSIRAMDSHPFYPNIMLICDSYGKIMLTDIFENYIINIFQERAFHLNHPSFCLVPTQCRFSQDGLSFLVVTEYGNISLYGYDIKDFYKLFPTQQLFSTDYYQFQIDPKTYKPVISLQSRIDVNLLGTGQLENMRHQPYQNIVKINVKELSKQIKNPTPKEEHKNIYYIQLSEVQRISECMLDCQRNFQIFKQSMEEIQIKRMTILYEQEQARQNKLKELIQEKINKLKEIDQNISVSLMNNPHNHTHSNGNSLNTSQGPSSGTYSQFHQNSINHNNIKEQSMEQSNKRYLRSTGNANNNNVGMIQTRMRNMNIRNYNEGCSDYNAEEGGMSHGHLEEEEYRIDRDGECSEQSEVHEEDDEFQDNESEDIYTNNISRARARSSKRKRRLRRANDDNNNTNNPSNNNKRTYNFHTRFQTSRRSVNQPSLQFINTFEMEYGNKLRKRVHENSEEYHQHEKIKQHQHSQEQSKKQIRKVAKQSVTQIIIEKELCQLCSQTKFTVTCIECKIKKYCDGCRSFRGKKINQNTNYICFQCYYNTNTSPQIYKNVVFEKYIRQQRNNIFVPQIGDQVAYFFQGYEEFLLEKIDILNNKYKNLGILFDILPHETNEQLTSITKCTVIDISYAFPLQQIYQLSYQNKQGARGRCQFKSTIQEILSLLTLKTTSDKEFKVFHCPGYEFLIKWEIYDDIIQNDKYGKFKLNQMVKIKDEQVQIIEIRPMCSLHPLSIWKNIIVHKAENKFLRRPRDKNDDISINIWNIDGIIDEKAFEYRSTFSSVSSQHYKNQIIKIENKNNQLWQIFGEFVNTELYPNYNQFVQVSMCLKLIINRLQNNYYASEQSFLRDLKLLTQNSVQFNGRDSQFTKMAQLLTKMIIEGDNFSNGKEHDELTQKKSKSKRKNNSNSNHHHSDHEKERQEKIADKKNDNKLSKYNQQHDNHFITKKSIPKKNKYIQQQLSGSEDYILQEFSESQHDESQELEHLRKKIRTTKVSTKKNKNNNNNYRITRSRTKN